MDTSPPPSLRLFLALWPDDAVRERLRAARDAWAWPRGATPVATGKLHLTLHFLGAVPAERLPDLRAGFAVPCPPFDLRLGRPALWHGGIAVLAPHEQPTALLDLQARLAEALASLGLQPEARAYRPHVTMARRAGKVALPPQGPDIGWHVNGYALVASGPEGYAVLQEYSCAD
ncbi:RNA 2',3'-cyclic phosphodiesterase [uncultured Massilia sp.]|uniref:RNA 2',3'-cyclic phosphodiesterase n=1 Tax=uncultured Massilia sp. TaxID=169973 RepID=UPI0025D8C032|nr:RNA 2',3'-cyclic phosphodiesterase [uncultured Massilia sp.]